MTMLTALPDIIESFRTATEQATNDLPSFDSLQPPENGITLLDTKNEIFLSYLQALALRNLNVIRSIKDGSDVNVAQKFSEDMTKKLVEHRLYLERGVRPLEQKLKYQIDRVVKTAEEEERLSAQKLRHAASRNGRGRIDKEDNEQFDQDDEDSDSDVDLGAGMSTKTSFKPQHASMMETTRSNVDKAKLAQSAQDGVYRPPRISATAMPTTDHKERTEKRLGRSKTIDEYVSTELSAAPLAQPSIGSNLAAGGRQTKNARQLREDAERLDYEETNLVRLPSLSKKEKAKRGLGKARDGGFGGEEWKGLGESVDRIGDMTRKKGKETVLDKSRKRRAVEDGPRGDGIGARFDVKRRRLQKKGQI